MENAFEQLPRHFQLLLTLEQCQLWRPERFRTSAAPDADIERYLPEKRPLFRLPIFKVRAKHLFRFGKPEESALNLPIQPDDGYEGLLLLPIHPAELHRYTEFLERVGAQEATREMTTLFATPTSSTRTLFVWPDGQPNRAMLIKLSLLSRVLGDRRIHRRRVASSVGLSQFVCRDIGDPPAGIRYFHELAGLVPRLMPQSGVVFRTMPDEIRNGGTIAAPLFTLIGGSRENPPLFLRIERSRHAKISDVLEGTLLKDFARLWIHLVFEHGLILEAHAQDLLLALTPDLAPLNTLYYRDFEGLTVDWCLRRARRLPEPRSLPNAFEWFSTYDTWGYPMYQLVSTKMMTSLYDYVFLVLGELESALLGWQAAGVVIGERITAGQLTSLFSRYLRTAIRETYGLQEKEEYDIRCNLNRFVKFLLQIRREILGNGK